MSSTADADIGLITPDDRGRVVLIYHAPVAMGLFGIICCTGIAAACLTCWWQIVFHDVPFLQHVQHGALLVYAIGGALGVPMAPTLILNFIYPLTLVVDDTGIYRSNIGLTKAMKWSDINRITVEHVYDRHNKNRYKTTVIGPNGTLNWFSFFNISPAVLGRYLAKRQSEVCPASPCTLIAPKVADGPTFDVGVGSGRISKERDRFDKKVLLPILIGIGVICVTFIAGLFIYIFRLTHP
jgi:hypothetical protein